MSSSNWKEMLKSQQADIDRLEAMDKALSNESDAAQISADTESILSARRPSSNSLSRRSSMVLSAKKNGSADLGSPSNGPTILSESEYKPPTTTTPSKSSNSKFINKSSRLSTSAAKSPRASSVPKPPPYESFGYGLLYEGNEEASPMSPLKGYSVAKGQNPMADSEQLNKYPQAKQYADSEVIYSPPDGHGGSHYDQHGNEQMGAAPDTADRYLKAKVKMLTKQLEESGQIKKKLDDMNKDIQRQLHTEREENKRLNKRVQTLEAEMRKNAGRQINTPNSKNSLESLQQEVALLRKDLETSERLAKQSNNDLKAKDLQLKRAAETINKLKSQAQEQEVDARSGEVSKETRVKTAEAKVKMLEKQKAELVDGFRKQMKLIDVLKRQKVHIEAARLLAFTEEEFAKTLSWTKS